MTLLRWPTAAELGAQWLSIKIFQKVILPQLMAATIEHLLMNRGRTTKTKVWVEISEYKMCLIWDCKTCDESIWNLSFMFEIETKAFSWIRSLDLPCSIFHRCKHRYTATFENSDWNLEVQIPDCLMQNVLDTNFFGCKFCWIYAPNPRKIHLVSWLNIATFTCNWLSSEDSEHDPIHQNRFHHLSPRFF